MTRTYQHRYTPKPPKKRFVVVRTLLGLLAFSGGISFGVYHFVYADTATVAPVAIEIDPNIGLEQLVEDFFTDNNAPEMIPIIRCESNFKHYEDDGNVLKNRQGSSAIGIAQVMASLHPDPKIVYRYNERHKTDLRVEDIDITTVEGNLGYALMLYEINGTRDWECAKKFRFR